MNALYVYYALLPLSGDDYQDHTFAGTATGEQTGTVLDCKVRVAFADPAALDAVNYALYASQAVYALRNAFYFADETAASMPAATPETLANSTEARLSSGGVTAYSDEQQVGGLSLEISYTVTGSDGASATRTHTPAATEGGTGLIVAASGL